MLLFFRNILKMIIFLIFLYSFFPSESLTQSSAGTAVSATVTFSSCAALKDNIACKAAASHGCSWYSKKCDALGSCEGRFKDDCNGHCVWLRSTCVIEACPNGKSEDECKQVNDYQCVWIRSTSTCFYKTCSYGKTEDICNEIGKDWFHEDKCVWETEWIKNGNKYETKSYCRTSKGKLTCKELTDADVCNAKEDCVMDGTECNFIDTACKNRKSEDECKELGPNKCVWEAVWYNEEHKYKVECRTAVRSCKSYTQWDKCETTSEGTPCIWNAFKKEPDCVPLHDFCHQLGSSSPIVCESIWDCVWKDNQCTSIEPSN